MLTVLLIHMGYKAEKPKFLQRDSAPSYLSLKILVEARNTALLSFSAILEFAHLNVLVYFLNKEKDC